MTIDLKALSAPFPPDRVSWRVGSTTADKKRGMALAYLDSRDVQDRLDEVCGPDNWQSRYPHANGKTVCEIGILIVRKKSMGPGDPPDREWVWKADGAGDTDFEAEKGALSDAFKRAAVRWGIGRYLYDVDAPWVDITPVGKSYAIAPHEMPKLRALLEGKKAPPKPDKAPVANFYLTHPDGKAEPFERASQFLDALETTMTKKGNDPNVWWALNGSSAETIAAKFPQAAKRVESLQQLAMVPV